MGKLVIGLVLLLGLGAVEGDIPEPQVAQAVGPGVEVAHDTASCLATGTDTGTGGAGRSRLASWRGPRTTMAEAQRATPRRS